MEKIPKFILVWAESGLAIPSRCLTGSVLPGKLFFKHMDKGCIFKMIFVKVGYSLGGKADLDGSAVFFIMRPFYKLVGTEGID